MKLLSWVLHHRRFHWVPAAEINEETGSMDDYCTCWLCRWQERRERPRDR